MLVRLSDWAWIKDFPKEKKAALKNALTVYPVAFKQNEVKPVYLYRERDDYIGIPRSFFEERRSVDHDIIDARVDGLAIDVPFVGKLKKDQAVAMDTFIDVIDAGKSGGIVKASPGWGKTVFAIATWCKIKRNALVIVQREYLANQWKKRIEKFAPSARVGMIQKDKLEYGDDYDISIATIQTLVARHETYPIAFWSSFGVVITDEAHRIGAPSWASIGTMFTGKVRLGLTATPRRKDGAQNVFFYHIGPVVYSSKVKRLTPHLRRIFTEFRLSKTPNFDPDLASRDIKIRFLCANFARNRLIVSELVKAVGAGRKIMVLSERRKHLDLLNNMFLDFKPDNCKTDFYVGLRTQKELDIAECADVVFATYQMAREALDIPSLDTLFLVTPSSDVEQSVGRIMRESEDKKKPVVTDFIDQHVSGFVRSWNDRRRFYIKEGIFKEEIK